MAQDNTEQVKQFQPQSINTTASKTSSDSNAQNSIAITRNEAVLRSVNPSGAGIGQVTPAANPTQAVTPAETGKTLSEQKNETVTKLSKNAPKVIRENRDVHSGTMNAGNLSHEDRRKIAKARIIQYREDLQNVEQKIFANYEQTTLTRAAYDSFYGITKNKRKDAAIERENNAGLVRHFMETQYTEEKNYGIVINAEQMKSLIDEFMNDISRSESDISSDENFIRSLKFNYDLTRTADMMKKWINDAVDGGYMPEGVDMDAVYKKIATFDELKEYLDARVTVITSPYYLYFSNDDVKYSDDQLKYFIQSFAGNKLDEKTKSDNKGLLEYLTAVQSLRKLSVKRNKGLTSIEEKTERKAKHEAEILRTRAEKREAVSRLSEHALNQRGLERFQDKHYDDKYTRERFEFLVGEFGNVKISDIHFAGIKDITDYYEENMRLFEQAREMEHMFFMAVRRGDADNWTDDQMIEMRAKLRSFDLMERFVSAVQKDLLQHSEEALHNYSYEELWQRATDSLKIGEYTPDIAGYPGFGENLEKFQKSILKTYKKEHAKREETIKTMYGLMYPEEIKQDDDDDSESGEDEELYRPGRISREELDRRKRDFQKNAVITDYTSGAENYARFIANNRYESFVAAYQKKYGIDPGKYFKPDRTMGRYLVGKSAEEMSRIVRILSSGKEEEKREFWLSVYREAYEADLSKSTGDSRDEFLDNFWYKNRMGGMLGNIDGLATETPAGYFSDQEKKELTALHHLGTGYNDLTMILGQKLNNHKYAHGLTLEDFLKQNEDAFNMGLWLSTTYLGEDSQHKEYKVGGIKYADKDNAALLFNMLGVPYNTFSKRTVEIKKNGDGRSADNKKYDAAPGVKRFYEFRDTGAWKDTTTDDLKMIRSNLKKAVSADVPNVEEPQAIINVLSADLREFDLKSYRDLTEEKVSKLYPLILQAQVLLARLKPGPDGRSRGLKSDLATKLGENGLKALRARCKTLDAAGTIFGPRMVQMINLYEKLDPDFGDMKSMDEMLHRPPKYYEDLKKNVVKDSKESIAEFKQKVEYIESFVKDLQGYDIFTSLSVTEAHMRSEEKLRNADMSAETLAGCLTGEESVLKNINDGGISQEAVTVTELIGPLAKTFKEKKLTVHEREALLELPGSVQQQKKAVGMVFTDAALKFESERFKIKNSISTATRVKIGDAALEDMAALMYGDLKTTSRQEVEQLETFAKMYADKAQRDNALDRMTESLIRLPLSMFAGVGTADFRLASNAPTLENISHKIRAYRNLLEANPDYVRKLRRRYVGNGKSDYDRVCAKLDRMLAFSDYYRACKLLMTDNYYILHDNEEIGRTASRNMTADQRRVYELTGLIEAYARRIRGGMFDGRSLETGQDRILTELEKYNRKQAYLTGRPDLTKIDPADVQKTHGKIKKFLRKLEAVHKGDYKTQIFKYDPQNDLQLQKYGSKEVTAFLDAYKVAVTEVPSDSEKKKWEKTWTPRQLNLYKKMRDLCKKKVPKTDSNGNPTSETEEVDIGLELVFRRSQDDKDVMYGKSGPLRFVSTLAHFLSDDYSDEELIDMVDGMTFIERENIDLSDEATYQYAKKRWLRSVKKMYDILNTNLKRYERTYGSLEQDISAPCFMHSLGDGQAAYIARSRFGQELTQICTEVKSTYNGKPATLCDILVAEGMLDRSEAEDSSRKCSNYYQNSNGSVRNFVKLSEAFFGMDNPGAMFTLGNNTMINCENTRNITKIEGPGLSLSEQRKFWKKAIATGYSGVHGDDVRVDYQKTHLNLLSSAERRSLKNQRERDRNIYLHTKECLDVRAKDLYNASITRLSGFDLSDDQKALIKKMMAFHPGLYRDLDEKKKKDQESATLFETHLKNFLGLGIEAKGPEEKNKLILDRKREAFAYFLNAADKLSDGVVTRDNRAEDIMTRDNVRTADNPVLDSSLIRMETCHRMFDVLQDMAADQKELYWFSENMKSTLKSKLFQNMRIEVIRLTLVSTFYLQLGDIGGKNEGEIARRFLMLQDLGRFKVKNEVSFNLDRTVFGDPEMIAALKDYGVRLDDWLSRPLPKMPVVSNRVAGSSLYREERAQETTQSATQETAQTVTQEAQKTTQETSHDRAQTVTQETAKSATQETDKTVTQEAQKTTQETSQDKSQSEIREEDKQESKPENKQENKAKNPEELRKIYTPEAKAQKEQELQKLIESKKLPVTVPKDRDDLVAQRMPFYGKEYKAPNAYGELKTQQTWKEDADKEMAELFDWLMEYYKVNDKTLDLNTDKNEKIVPLPVKEYDVGHEFPQMAEYYEDQSLQNCFCVTGNAMVSNLQTKLNKLDHYTRSVPQYKMREYRPRIRKFDKRFETEAAVDYEQYGNQVADMDAYCGKGKETAGNIFEDADYLFEAIDKRIGKPAENICLNSIRYVIPSEKMQQTENGMIKARNQIEIFKETVARAVNDQQVVGVLRVNAKEGSHYVTVTRISGDRIYYYDSLPYYGSISSASIEKFFKDTSTVELNWFSEEKDPGKLTEEYSNLTYDEENGYDIRKLDPETVRYVGHTKGVTVRKSMDKMPKGWNDVVQSIYIPNKKLKIPTVTMDEFMKPYKVWKAKVDKEKEDVKANKKTQEEADKAMAELNKELPAGTLLTEQDIADIEADKTQKAEKRSKISEETGNENVIIEHSGRV
ncbi:MAG: hypothetical protein IJ058_13425 [Lachnospiraceae bacterium]|nr:hypothetical protein [Lachnospiraceae bacterium]